MIDDHLLLLFAMKIASFLWQVTQREVLMGFLKR